MQNNDDFTNHIVNWYGITQPYWKMEDADLTWDMEDD